MKTLPFARFDQLAGIPLLVEETRIWPEDTLDAFLVVIPEADGHATAFGQRLSWLYSWSPVSVEAWFSPLWTVKSASVEEEMTTCTPLSCGCFQVLRHCGLAHLWYCLEKLDTCVL